MKLQINALRIAAMALLLTSVHTGSAWAGVTGSSSGTGTAAPVITGQTGGGSVPGPVAKPPIVKVNVAQPAGCYRPPGSMYATPARCPPAGSKLK